MTNVVKVCPECGSASVWKDATAVWCFLTQQWTLSGVQDREGCNDCDAEGDGFCEDVQLDQGISS